MEERMRRIIIAFALISLCGCAARVFEVKLAPPEPVPPVADVTVQDARLDPQIYMTGISMGSNSNIYLLDAEPPLDVTLQRFIQSMALPSVVGPTLTVRIERLELKNKVGFAKADELYCELESSVTRRGSSNARVLVKTYSKNVENMSPLVTTSARIILRQCLEQHAKEIVQQLTDTVNGR